MNQKHGYPLHISILSHKLDITVRMLKMRNNLVNANILTSIQANILHLLFVKYEKDKVLGKEILTEAVSLGVDANHIDSLEASPLHVAVRKRQN